MKLSLNFTLLQQANLFAPTAQGIQDILLCNEHIVAIERLIPPDRFPDCQVIPLHGKTVCPGLIDQHVHLIGGGGEAGFTSRTPEARLSHLVGAGITTVVGLLGTDSVTRHPQTLLAKVNALNNSGMTAYMLTGAYTVPTPTITASIMEDVAFITPIIGTKVAVSDHRSSAPTIETLCQIAASARVGGLLGHKAGITVFHMGNHPKAMAPIEAILQQSEVPIEKLLPTHVNRNKTLFAQAIQFAKQGGYIDITSGINPLKGASNAVKPSQAIKLALEEGVPLQRLTMSSDGQGSQPEFSVQGELIGLTVGGFDSLLSEVRDLVQQEGFSLEEALAPVTSNVAKFLHLKKGVVERGAGADLLVLDQDLQLEHAFAKGKRVVTDYRPCVKETFE